jgi:hypothetical protein
MTSLWEVDEKNPKQVSAYGTSSWDPSPFDRLSTGSSGLTFCKPTHFVRKFILTDPLVPVSRPLTPLISLEARNRFFVEEIAEAGPGW